MGLILIRKIKRWKKRKFNEINDKITDCLHPRKTRMVVEFNNKESTNIKSFAVRKNEIKATMQFMSHKLLMFAKVSSMIL